MNGLSSGQRRFLRSHAHRLRLKPLVQVGKLGVTDALVNAVSQVLEAHELVKVRFLEHKDDKDNLSMRIAERTDSLLVGIVGHIALFYRLQQDPEKRKIDLPS